MCVVSNASPHGALACSLHVRSTHGGHVAASNVPAMSDSCTEAGAPESWSPSLGPHAAAVSPAVTPEKVDVWAWVDHACAAQVQRITWIVREGV